MASSSSSSSKEPIKVKDRRYVTFKELLYYKLNSRIVILPANNPKNLLGEDYLVLTEDESCNLKQTTVPITLFEDKWHIIYWSKTQQHFFLGTCTEASHYWDHQGLVQCQTAKVNKKN